MIDKGAGAAAVPRRRGDSRRRTHGVGLMARHTGLIRANHRVRSLLVRVPIVMAAALASWTAAADTLIVQGSSTFNRRVLLAHHAAIEVASGQTLTVIPNKSTPGLIALLEGRAQLAMISAPLASEIEALRKLAPAMPSERLHAFEITATRIAIGVHPSNPVRQASLEDIKRILLGEITNWKELGGSDLPIRVALAGGGGIAAVIESELLKGAQVTARNALDVSSPEQLIQVIEQSPDVVGLAQLSLVRRRNIPEIVTDRPLQTTLSLVTLDEPTPAMQAVIDAARRFANQAM
jgi:ABC-type phosphate transport system substrate-binding protein